MQLGGKVTFCETFDQKNPGIQSRTGDLNPNVWGVSRSGGFNIGQGEYNGWAATQLLTCSGTTTVAPPNDIMICNGQLREASNDNPSGVLDAGVVTSLALYPKQPFDFAGRTGTVSFDVSNDTHGDHAAWPEFWMSNLPVPTPFNHFDSWQALPQHGFGVRFAASADPGQFGLCPNTNNINSQRWTVDSAVVVRNYVMEDVNYQGVDFGTASNPPLKLNILDCVIQPADGSGIMNHVEVRVNQGEIDIYATDAGVAPSPTTLRKIASITNANLTLTRGLVGLQDVHYNADEGGAPSQRQHTFVWDNVAFDGPFTYRDFSYDALDVNQLNAATSAINLGKVSSANQTASWNVLNLPAKPQASTVRVSFNFTAEFNPVPRVLNVVVNGHTHQTPWPYPDTLTNTWRTIAVTIPITDLVPGTNVVQLGSDQPMVTSNVNIVLDDVPGGVPVLPGSNNAYPVGGSGTIASPTVAFSASPTSITAGQISMATWSSTNATSCTAGGGWTGTKATSGTLAVSPPSSTTYNLTCAGAGGTSPMASATVAVNAAPVAINGLCGSSNGTQASSAPSTNLCSAGTSSSVAGSGPWTWSCGGSNGGTSASCSASVLVASGSGSPSSSGSGSTSSSGSGSTSSSGSGSTPTPTPTPVSGNCSMQLGGTVTFCETFDQKNPGIQSRTGDLNPNVWGVSRATGSVNFGQGQYNAAAATTQLLTCSGTTTVAPPNDIMICNGQLHESSNDNPSGVFDAGGVTSLAMYPKQPFDFAGRTGTVSFDVSNDTHGNHAAWPEFWMSNLPVPTPFNHFDSLEVLPQHGFGVRFAAGADPGQWGLCPNGNNLNSTRWTVDSAVVVRNYVMEDVNYQGVDFGTASNPPLKLNILDCVIAPPDGSGITNHVEVRVNQNEIDIYASDAGIAASPTTLRKIASITNANLTLTRGLVWLEDVHYNADKGGAPSERIHTFIWDNVAFDGPFTYRDFSYDALDVNQIVAGYPYLVNLGQFSSANQTASWNVLNMPANPQASAVRVLFNFSNELNPVPTVLNVVVNGHAHPTPWPYPDTLTNTERTFAVTIPITDLVPGTNVVQLGSDQPMATSNVNIVLVDVPGGVPVLPGSNNAYPAGPSQ
jgi:hypothetical protein